MSGHCDFCGIWHSGSCFHPARQTMAALEARIRKLEAELAESRKRHEGARGVDWAGEIDAALGDRHE